jgi:hypothetical protein
MDRKDFLKASLYLGAFCGALPGSAQDNPTADKAADKPGPPSAPANPCAGAMGYARHWVKDLIDQADAQLTEPQRKALLEARGRSCARSGAAMRAVPFKGRLDDWIAELRKHMGPDAASRAGDVLTITYPKCLCPLVSDFEEPLSTSYCFCSAGWLKEVYETISGASVGVEILETVKRGGQRCRFEVRLKA